jgi:hypothetical protein
MAFAITGIPAGGIVVESSTNLLHWLPVSTNSSAPGSVWITNSATGPARFYRARPLSF